MLVKGVVVVGAGRCPATGTTGRRLKPGPSPVNECLIMGIINPFPPRNSLGFIHFLKKNSIPVASSKRNSPKEEEFLHFLPLIER